VPALRLPTTPPRVWPRFDERLRSIAVTARLGRVLGIAIAVSFVTGLLSHYQYQPWSWLPEPAHPVWGYRLTQGVHVLTGIASIPLLLAKLWSVYPRLFAWPPVRSLVHLVERLSVGLLVAVALVELVTGFLNVLAWYPWPWPFVSVHRFLGYVLAGSVLLHVAVKLPAIRAALARPLAEDGDPATGLASAGVGHPAAGAGQPAARAGHSTPFPVGSDPAAGARDPAPVAVGSDPATGLSRRGFLTATGVGVSLVAATTAGQSVGLLQPLAVLAPRRADAAPQHVPVNKTAAQARVHRVGPDWQLEVAGPRPFVLPLAELEAAAQAEARLPIACVEGWSVDAHWRGVRLLDLVRRAGGTADSTVYVRSLQPHGAYAHSTISGPQLGGALLATHLNGERLDLDHGYPVRLIAPDRAGVLNTKWLARVEIR